MLLKEDFWIGEAITGARLAFECWDRLLNGEIAIEPEFPADSPGPYATLFANYSKREFLRSVALLHRGFFDRGAKTPVALRIEEVVSVERIDKFLELARPFREFRNQEDHRENPQNSPVWTIQIDEPRRTIGTTLGDRIDPLSVYEILKSLEPDIGYFAFVRSLRDA
jgi:hypothetical protein